MMNVKVGQAVVLNDLTKRDDESRKNARKNGVVIEVRRFYVVVQHKHYKECYTKHDFNIALVPGGASIA